MATILIIDDDVVVLYTLRTVLEAHGHDVFEASDGDEGVSEYQRMLDRSNVPDLVIVDILMPVKGGYETITEIRRSAPDVKIVAISGGGDVDPKVILDISRILGADRLLTKPFLPEELLSVVDRCVA